MARLHWHPPTSTLLPAVLGTGIAVALSVILATAYEQVAASSGSDAPPAQVGGNLSRVPDDPGARERTHGPQASGGGETPSGQSDEPGASGRAHNSRSEAGRGQPEQPGA